MAAFLALIKSIPGAIAVLQKVISLFESLIAQLKAADLNNDLKRIDVATEELKKGGSIEDKKKAIDKLNDALKRL